MSVQTLIKQPSESRLYSINFQPNLVEGATIDSVTSVVVVPDPGLVLGAAAVSSDGKEVLFRASEGEDGTTYKITVLVEDTSGNILEGEGNLKVMDL